jgi:hypothetical protein
MKRHFAVAVVLTGLSVVAGPAFAEHDPSAAGEVKSAAREAAEVQHQVEGPLSPDKSPSMGGSNTGGGKQDPSQSPAVTDRHDNAKPVEVPPAWHEGFDREHSR